MNDITSQTLDLLRKLQGDVKDIRKATTTVTTATGLTAYDLQAPSKNLYPVNTPIRNLIPRIGGGTGPATNWRAINAILGSGYNAMGWVAEGQRAAAMSYTVTTKAATYKTIGEEEAVTFESINAAVGYEDIAATAVVRLLQKAMLKEEVGILGGNSSVALGTPTAPTTSSSGTGGTLPTLTYDVAVVALTLEGYLGSTLTAPLAIPLTITVTGQDGATYVLKGGSSMKSSVTTQAVTLPAHLFASAPVVTGAVAYAWFIGAAGAAKLEAITTINSLDFSTALAGTGTAIASVIADNSQNTLAWDGLMYSAYAAGSNAYIKALATGVSGTGTVLTAGVRGNVPEIDAMLKSMWDNYQVSPTQLWVSSQELQNITNKVLSAGSSSILRYTVDAGGPVGSADPYGIVANGQVDAYYNPYCVNPRGGAKIPIRIHPILPAGTLVAWADNLPIQYQSSNVPNVAEMKLRQDYYQIDWPLVTRARQVGVYAEEVLAVYAPFAMGIITNIASG